MQLRFGIREKLLLPLMVGLIVIISVLFFLWQPSQLEKAKQDFIKDQTNILKTLNPSLVQNILSNDLSALHSIIENSLLIHKDEWRYIQLINIDGEQLYPIFTSEPESTNTLLNIKLKLVENEEGFGEIFLSTDWNKEKIKQTANINRISLWSLFLFIVIAFISYIFQTTLIYNPITKLKNITLQLSNGDYSIKLPKRSRDEIGSLTDSIDQMRNKIQYTLNELVDKEKIQRAIVESVPDGIITIDEQSKIQSFNHGAENIFQYTAKEVIGNNISMFLPEEVALENDLYLKSLKSRPFTKNTIELIGIKKDGSHFPIELTLNPKLINKEVHFTGILRDITERQKVDRLKDEFVSTVSHELRTPLTAIKGSLDLVTKGFDLDLPEQATTMLDVANRNVERLLTLINDILDVSKLESGEINFQLRHLSIKPFIDDTININQEYAKKHNTIFKCTDCHEDVQINTDRDRLVQVMSNLLSNAAKYSPADIPVEIFTEVDNGILRVNIRDHGLGIPKDFQEKLFKKFTQSNSGDTRDVVGTGLGLSISKMIIEKLGGNIGFKTIEGKETTFYFELPIINSN